MAASYWLRAASNAGDAMGGGGGHGGSEARVRVSRGKIQGREEREEQGAGCSTYPPWGARAST